MEQLAPILGRIIKNLISVLATGALIIGSIGLAGPAAAAPSTPINSFNISIAAATAKAPKIVNGKVKTTKTKKPKASIQTVTLPILKNSTVKNRKAFAKYANELVQAELKVFNSSRGNCGKYTAEFDIKPQDKGIYKGRYATVSMFTFMYLCGATGSSMASSFTLDLKTGKKTGIGTFVAQDDVTTKIAVANNFYASKNSCIKELNPASKKGSMGYVPRPAAWTVSAKGVKFHFPKYSIGAGACGVPAVVLPWNEVATASKMKGAVKDRLYVNGVKYNKKGKFYTGEIIATSTQGRKLTVLEASLWGEASCLGGVRSGKNAVLGDPWWAGPKVKAAFKDTSSNPKLVTSKYGKGWHEASAAEAKMVQAALGVKKATARSLCDI